MTAPPLVGLLLKAVAGLGAWEVLQAALRFNERGVVFAKAQARAMELGRKLVVVGDPDSGAHTKLARAYGCGDLCIDLNGCPACPDSVKLDLAKESISLPADSAVVFVSCVLEYVDDLVSVWRELRRVAGAELYVVTMGRWSLAARFFPGTKWNLAPRGAGFLATRIGNDQRDGSALLGLS